MARAAAGRDVKPAPSWRTGGLTLLVLIGRPVALSRALAQTGVDVELDASIVRYGLARPPRVAPAASSVLVYPFFVLFPLLVGMLLGAAFGAVFGAVAHGMTGGAATSRPGRGSPPSVRDPGRCPLGRRSSPVAPREGHPATASAEASSSTSRESQEHSS